MNKKQNVHQFKIFKQENRKISMITAYDYAFAKLVNSSNIDSILVGDSLAMVMHGYPSTVNATVEMMALHTAAVARGAPDKFVIADMPFLSYRKDKVQALDAVQALVQAGAEAVKLEGVMGHENMISHIVESGIPVMGHIGLTPQSIHQIGGFKVQGRDREQADYLMTQAKKIQELGCFAIVLECVPAELAGYITRSLSIPTVGIGAGQEVSGQILVLQDLLGMSLEFKPKFLRHFLQGSELIVDALNRFDKQVKTLEFPTRQESY